MRAAVKPQGIVQPVQPLSYAPTGFLQRKCACGGSAGLSGTCETCQQKTLTGSQPPLIQPKLKVSQPNDPYEQEADRVADQVMRMPEPTVQRAVATGKQDEEDENKEGLVQRKVAGPTPASSSTVSHPFVSNLGPGQPLDAGTRSFFEPRFGHDLSHVRVHADTLGAESAHSIQARAYTLGRDVVFGAGQYRLGTSRGQRLLAHELTHVIQQRALGTPSTQQCENRVIQRAPDRELEQKAEALRLKNAKAGGVVTTYPLAESTLESVAASRLASKVTNATIPLGALEDMRTGLDNLALDHGVISLEVAQARKDEVHWVPDGFRGFVRRLEILGHGTTGPKPEDVAYTFAGASPSVGIGYSAKDLREFEKKQYDFSRYLVDGATVHLEGCSVGKGELGRKFLYQVGRLFFGSKNGFVIANTCFATKSVLLTDINPCNPVTYKWPEDFADLLRINTALPVGGICDPLDDQPSGFGCFPVGDTFTLQALDK